MALLPVFEIFFLNLQSRDFDNFCDGNQMKE